MTALLFLTNDIILTPVYLAAFAAKDEQAPILAILAIPLRLTFATISQPHLPDNRSVQLDKEILFFNALPTTLSTALCLPISSRTNKRL